MIRHSDVSTRPHTLYGCFSCVKTTFDVSSMVQDICQSGLVLKRLHYYPFDSDFYDVTLPYNLYNHRKFTYIELATYDVTYILHVRLHGRTIHAIHEVPHLSILWRNELHVAFYENILYWKNIIVYQ